MSCLVTQVLQREIGTTGTTISTLSPWLVFSFSLDITILPMFLLKEKKKIKNNLTVYWYRASVFWFIFYLAISARFLFLFFNEYEYDVGIVKKLRAIRVSRTSTLRDEIIFSI